MEYLFFLGQNTDLSQAELKSLLPSSAINTHSHFAHLQSKSSLNLDKLICRLGGTVKIATFIKKVSPDQLIEQSSAFICQQSNKNFSLSQINTPLNQTIQLNKQLKDHLSNKDFSSRYLKPRKPFLSPVIVKTQNVTELTYHPQTNSLFHTTHLHPFKHWITRDRRKPYITPKQGMLPPKLARIMVNLGLKDSPPKQTTLLDPFCGTGTILTEAALLGLHVVGNDLSPQKVAGSKQNLNWLPQDHFCQQPEFPADFYQNDATHLSQYINQPIHLIVTEPSLGPVSPDPNQFEQIAQGLQKLYLGALKDWQNFLTPQTTVVMAFPRFKKPGQDITTHDFIDSHPALRYNIIDSSLIFTRPQATIERQILILKFNPKNGKNKSNR